MNVQSDPEIIDQSFPRKRPPDSLMEGFNLHSFGLGRIGKEAGVKVDEKTVKKSCAGKADTRISYASAHDLRRAFGTRWARRVPAMVLKELMRHESVTTTEKFYVDIDADATAAMLAELMQRNEGVSPYVEANRVMHENQN